MSDSPWSVAFPCHIHLSCVFRTSQSSHQHIWRDKFWKRNHYLSFPFAIFLLLFESELLLMLENSPISSSFLAWICEEVLARNLVRRGFLLSRAECPDRTSKRTVMTPQADTVREIKVSNSQEHVPSHCLVNCSVRAFLAHFEGWPFFRSTQNIKSWIAWCSCSRFGGWHECSNCW